MSPGPLGYPPAVTTSATKSRNVRNVLLALALGGGALIAGCGDTDDDTDGGTTESTESTEAPVEDGTEQSDDGTDEQPDTYNDNDNDGEPPAESDDDESGAN